tara:strand:+ start:173 stop:379 length:207 start_codon:yes stop_codon:yes gene_type:complete
MKPIDVVRKLVDDNPNDMLLGEVVRQYIRELNESMTCQYSGLRSTSSYKTWPGTDAILNGANVEKVSE